MLTFVSKRISFLALTVIFILPFLYSCAPEVTVKSCTSQKYYPGRQEVAPYQEIVIQFENLSDSIQLDSLVYGNQSIPLKGKDDTYFGQAAGTTFSEKATLYYRSKNKPSSILIDSISQLDPLYLP